MDQERYIFSSLQIWSLLGRRYGIFGSYFNFSHVIDQQGALVNIVADGTVQISVSGIEMGQGNLMTSSILSHSYSLRIEY
jgi:xanthine dehydrogenase molybdopterin-binding subunit B